MSKSKKSAKSNKSKNVNKKIKDSRSFAPEINLSSVPLGAYGYPQMCAQPQSAEAVDSDGAMIKEFGIASPGGRHNIYCLNIIGQVEGHYILPPDNKTTKYEHIIPALFSIEQDESVEGLLLVLNTVGGDVEAGLAIAEMVAGMKTPTASVVLGGGHSIGVPLAVCADKSFIVPSATMTIHPVRMNGPIVGVPQTLSYFQKMQDRIIRFITDNSNITEKKLRELLMATGEIVMDVGTVIDGEEAVNCGLIDSLGGLSDAIEWLYSEIDGKKTEENSSAEQ